MGTTPPDSLRLFLKESGIQLPYELITEILVCLPVKSLLRFKCVSKPWLSLISNPQFIRSHFSKSYSVDEGEDMNLQLLSATKIGMKICCLYSALHEADPSKHVSAIEFPDRNMHPIVGIINGLVCLNLKGTEDLCIWNPALNKIKHFNIYPEAPSGLSCVKYCLSFGYEESNDDYKVVCLQTDGVFHAQVRIYSLKADSWRRIDRLKGFCLPNPGVFANGKIYWSEIPHQTNRYGEVLRTKKWKIVSLDLSSEKFVELQHPEYDASNCLLTMGVSGGRPVVVCDIFKENKADLWVLDKCGVEECWSKLVSIPNTDVNFEICMPYYQVLCILSNGEIVFGSVRGLLVYDWKKKVSRKIKLFVGPTHTRTYVESLLWPHYA